MDIKGNIKSTNKKGQLYLLTIQGKNGTYAVEIEKTKSYLKKGMPITITDTVKKSRMFKTVFLLQKESFISVAPGILLTDIEINSSLHCKFFYPMMDFNGIEFDKSNGKERDFYYAVKGMTKNSEIAEMALRFPLSVRRKFTYKPLVLSTKFGLVIENALFFGKLPMVFKDNLTKGILLSILYNQEEFVLIEEEKGTLQRKSVSMEDKHKVMDARNNLVLVYLDKDINREALKCNNKNCAAYSYCKKVYEEKDKFDLFKKYFLSFLAKRVKEKKILYKTLRQGIHPLKGSLSVYCKETKREDDNFTYFLKIHHNEPEIKQGDTVLISEKPPLTKKVKGKVVEKTFEHITVKSREELITPGSVTPLYREIPVESGLFDFIYGDSVIRDIYLNKVKPLEQPFIEKMYIENDAEQNRAVNLILNMRYLSIINGEYGTGKKFVAKKAIENLVKLNKKILIVTDSRKEEFKQFFKDLVSENASLVSIYGTNEASPYTIKPNSFDYLFLFLNRDTDEKVAFSLFSKAKKSTIFTNLLSYPLIEQFKEKISTNSTIELLTEHRFGMHILHFLQPVLTTKLKSISDREIEIMNKNLVDKVFLDIVNPEKYVEFVEVRGKSLGKKNKWNIQEAQFILEVIKQFVKSGTKRESIGVITAFERQEMLLKSLLFNAKIPDIYVSTPDESMEKDIVLVSFTDKNVENSQLRYDENLKIALTRSRSKLILVGNKNVIKHSKILSQIL